MHDRTGKPLAKGDKVTISAVITDLSPTEDYCNVSQWDVSEVSHD